MNHCDNCGVDVDACLKNCPLCGKELTKNPQENKLYPTVKEQKYVDKKTVLDDTLTFIAFVFIVGSIVLNLLFWEGVPWFMGVAVSVLYVCLWLYLLMLSEWSAGAKTFLQMAGLIGMMLIFDYLGDWTGWSYEYALPFILAAGLIYIDLYSWIHKSLWRDNLVYAILFVILGFIPLMLLLSGVAQVIWPVVLCSAVSGGTILGILRFTVRYIAAEMKKRFHI